MAKERGWTLYELFQESRSLESLFLELTAGGKEEPPMSDSDESEAA